MTPLEAYAWMAWRPQRPVPVHPGFEDTQTMQALPAWLEPGGCR